MASELVIASSPVDTGINSWDFRTGASQLNYRNCCSPRHGLVSIGSRFIACSQLPAAQSSASAPIFFWSWEKQQISVKSFPAEPIGPLVSNSDGTYLIGGGNSGSIYIWEVASGKLLNKWHAHYRTVTCLSLSDDESLLISGAEDGGVRVWNLPMIFDSIARGESGSLYLYSFTEHTLRVTDLVSGRGFSNSIFISSSEDRTCKIWSLAEGKILRSIQLPAIVDAIVIDPGEHLFYAGCRDGRIYIIALNYENNPIVGTLYDNSKGITSIVFNDGATIVSGSEDGLIRFWDLKTQHMTRVLKHSKGPINNVLIVKPVRLTNNNNLLNQPSMSKYTDSSDNSEITRNIIILPQPCWKPNYFSSRLMSRHLKELQVNNSSGAAEMELERLRLENKKLMQMAQQWKKLCQEQQNFCVTQLLEQQ